jgi:hypothetical protein
MASKDQRSACMYKERMTNRYTTDQLDLATPIDTSRDPKPNQTLAQRVEEHREAVLSLIAECYSMRNLRRTEPTKES